MLDNPIAKAEQRLARGQRAQSSELQGWTACTNLVRPCSSRVSSYSSTVLSGFFRLARCCRIAVQTRTGIPMQLIDQKQIWMAGAKAMPRQGVLREIIQVEGDDQIGPAPDGGSQTMAIIRVG